MKKYIIILFLVKELIAQNQNYFTLDNHTLTLEKKNLEFIFEYQKMNDTLDIFKIKEKEFSSNSKFDSIGDLTGDSIGLRYGMTDNLMISIKKENKNIDYSGNTLKNKNYDLYLKYNIFNNEYSILNNGLSIAIGYTENKLENFYLNDLTAINDLISRYIPNKSIKITKPNNNYFLTYTQNGVQRNKLLTLTPYASLEDTKDQSFYLKLLTGLHTKNSSYDFYIGYKKTKIKNFIDTSIHYEPDADIQNELNNQSVSSYKYLDRNEYMLYAGLNIIKDFKMFIYEFGYEYEKFYRDQGLDYINYNHIIDMIITKPITKNFSIFAGGKIMYRQFNGQIPYLYNEYTQSSYDHKYGYARFGLQYRFEL